MTEVLVFTRTTGYRHEDAIAAGSELFRRRASQAGLALTVTEDPGVFEAPALRGVDAVVFHQTSGTVLDAGQRAALSSHLRGGCGFAGVHGASTAERDWPEYLDIVGARFLSHPKDQFQEAEVHPASAIDHPCLSMPTPWRWVDEWYCFEGRPSDAFEVLLTVDEASYDVEGVPMGPGHPLSWHGRHGAGRTWYTALGHHGSCYADPVFADHVWGGVTSVLRGR